MGSIGRSSTSAFNHNNKSNYSLSSQCLKYGRVKLYTELDPQLHKRLIDSVFIQLNETLQKIELQLGYKLTADIELQLFTDLDSYNDAFKETKIYVEQHNISRIYTKEKILPLFVAQRFQDIKSDIQFLVSYILLDEFLHGVGVKQRLNQGDAVRLPIWLIHGYCYLNAKPWSAKDADQFLFSLIKVITKIYIKSPRKHKPRSESIFGIIYYQVPTRILNQLFGLQLNTQIS